MPAAPGTAWSAALLLLAGSFAVVSGVNDGGALLSPGLRIPSLSTPAAFCLLTAATAAGPLLFGTRVAATFLGRLVHGGPGASAPEALAVGVAVALTVVLLLSLRGLPTSLTLAVVGGLAGAGLGAGRPVAAGSVATVLLAAALAPVVSSLIAVLATRALRLGGTRRSTAAAAVRRTHRVAFSLQCLAYGANDGQKMVALFAVAGGAAGTGTDSVRLGATALLVCGVLFGLGAALGLPRAAASLGSGIVPLRPLDTVTAELAAAIAVLGSAALGFPVSMTQSVAGGLFGTGLGQGARRVRWRQAGRIGAAWLLTLPLSIGAAAAVTLGLRELM